MTFVIRIQPSNAILFVEAGETILNAALRQGFDFPYSCHNGMCGTCAARLLQGQISYAGSDPLGLEDDETAAGYILLCSAIPQTDLIIEHAAAVAPWQMRVKTAPYQVSQMHSLSETIVQLLLEPTTDNQLHYRAGQYLYLHHSLGEKRPFSIANAPLGSKQIELHVRHTPDNDFSTQLLDDIAQGKPLLLEGPYGRCIYHESPALPIILIAGGTGFTHSKALIEYIAAHAPQTAMHLFWGAKTSADLYLNQLPQQWCTTLANFRYTPTISRYDEDQSWQGQTASLLKLVIDNYPDLRQYQVYCSGPFALTFSALQYFEPYGLRRDFMYSDAFEFEE